MLSFTICLAKEAGNVILQGVGNRKKISTKCSNADLVTEVDVQVEKLIKEKILLAFPHHKFIGEESSADNSNEKLTDTPTWMIDPIDGTTNFVHLFPNFCISIALVINKEVHIGVIYNPVSDELFAAEKGKGAFLNDVPIHVSDTQDLSSALVGSEYGSGRNVDELHSKCANIERVVARSHGLRSLGSAALHMCFVACGRTDAYFESGIHCWDVAAGHLLVQEAGGVSYSADGSCMDLMARGVLCAASKQLAEQIQPLFQPWHYERD